MNKYMILQWKPALLFLSIFSTVAMFSSAEAVSRFATLQSIEVTKPRVTINNKDAQAVTLILETADPKSIDSVELSINTGVGAKNEADGYFKWDKTTGFGKVAGAGVDYIDLVLDQCRYEIKGNSLVLTFQWTFQPLYGKFTDNHIIWRFSQYGKTVNDWEESSAKFATIADSLPPAPPLGLVAVHYDMGWFLSWDVDLEHDVAGYNAYRSFSKNGPYEKINTKPLKWDNYNDEKTVTVPVYYKVAALDADGNESKLSRLCQVL